jgi:hypothetical protein
MTSRKQNVQAAWVALNKEHKLLDQVLQQGVATLTAKQIGDHYETRFVTKIGERSELPPFLADNDLAILPLSRSNFIVGHFHAFHDLPNFDDELAKPIGGSSLVSLQMRPDSETTSILAALDTNMFDEFLGEHPAKLGIMGRMGTGNFTFKVDGYDKEISVVGSQMEIDAGIETPQSIAVIEAKSTEVGSFLVRQLYYPYRSWSQRVGALRKIRPVFLTVSNDRFRLIEYRFTDPGVYSSIEEIRHETFQLVDSLISPKTANELLLAPIAPVTQGVPYPQADRVDRIVSLLVSIEDAGGSIYKEDVATQQVFHSRQADYYMNAAKYLGYVEVLDETQQIYGLTPQGAAIVAAAPALRTHHLAERLLRDPVVREVFLAVRRAPGYRSSKPLVAAAKTKIEALVSDGAIQGVGTDSTAGRRAGTMVAWALWVSDHVKWS